MSRYYVDSFAYDFDLFVPQTKKTDNVLEINRRSSRKSASSPLPARRSRLRLSRPSALVMLLVMLLGLIAGNIYLRIKVTEVTSEISSCDVKLERAISENTSLEMELENRVSLKNLEQSAQALGMQKAERYQVRYLDVLGGDKTEVLKDGVLVTATVEE